MKTQLLLSLVLAGSVVASSAFAAEEQQANKDQSSNTSTIKMTDVQKKDEKVGDLDQEITNAKMRAESGSKSQWSVAADLTYNGGNLVDPLGKVRPNYSGIASQDNSTAFAADVAVAYRMTKRDSLRIGSGLTVLTPLHNNQEETTNQNSTRRTYVSNPYVSWARSFRAMDLQQSLSVTGSWETRPGYTAANFVGDVGVSYTVLGEIANSNWQPGISLSLSNTFFSDSSALDDTASNVENGRTDYSVGLFPFVEYAFNDKYSFRTVFRPASFDHYRSDAADMFSHNMWTQSVGLGIAVARDLYLYPNLQFAPEYMRSDRTNIGMNATINMF